MNSDNSAFNPNEYPSIGIQDGRRPGLRRNPKFHKIMNLYIHTDLTPESIASELRKRPKFIQGLSVILDTVGNRPDMLGVHSDLWATMWAVAKLLKNEECLSMDDRELVLARLKSIRDRIPDCGMGHDLRCYVESMVKVVTELDIWPADVDGYCEHIRSRIRYRESLRDQILGELMLLPRAKSTIKREVIDRVLKYRDDMFIPRITRNMVDGMINRKEFLSVVEYDHYRLKKHCEGGKEFTIPEAFIRQYAERISSILDGGGVGNYSSLIDLTRALLAHISTTETKSGEGGFLIPNTETASSEVARIAIGLAFTSWGKLMTIRGVPVIVFCATVLTTNIVVHPMLKELAKLALLDRENIRKTLAPIDEDSGESVVSPTLGVPEIARLLSVATQIYRFLDWEKDSDILERIRETNRREAERQRIAKFLSEERTMMRGNAEIIIPQEVVRGIVEDPFTIAWSFKDGETKIHVPQGEVVMIRVVMDMYPSVHTFASVGMRSVKMADCPCGFDDPETMPFECGHRCCRDCVDVVRATGINVCPVCRKPLPSDDEDEDEEESDTDPWDCLGD